MTYDIICPKCGIEFEHKAEFRDDLDIYKGYFITSGSPYKNGKCLSCESEFTFDWDCSHEEAVLIPVFLEPKFKL